MRDPPEDDEDFYKKEFQHRTLMTLHTAVTTGLVEPEDVRMADESAAAKHPLEYISLLSGDCLEATLCAGGCTSHTEAYWWEVCPFRYVRQASSRDAERPTLVGRFEGWNTTTLPSLVAPDANLSTPRALWRFGDGDRCPNGNNRQAYIELRCAPTTELVAVDEDGKCRYWMVVKTPFACHFRWTEEAQAAERSADAERQRKQREIEEAAAFEKAGKKKKKRGARRTA